MPEGIHYKKGISLERSNDSVIPTFLENLHMHPEYGDLHREVDLQQYRDKVVNYLKNHDIPEKETEEDTLDFRLEEQEQASLDIANRIIILANKVLVTTRETDVASMNISDVKYYPFDYLDSILETLNPIAGNDIISYGNNISHIMSLDEKRNLLPTLAVDGFRLLVKAYNSEKEQIDKRKGKFSLETLNSRYKEVLTGLLDYSQKLCENHGSYILPMEGKIKHGTDIINEIHRLLKRNNLRLEIIG